MKFILMHRDSYAASVFNLSQMLLHCDVAIVIEWSFRLIVDQHVPC
jgi:hypothetical protein